jgi:hypothetical protein
MTARVIPGQYVRARHPPLRAAAARFLHAPGADDRCSPLRLAAATRTPSRRRLWLSHLLQAGYIADNSAPRR